MHSKRHSERIPVAAVEGWRAIPTGESVERFFASIWNDSVDDLRYLLMRTLRLILSIAFEIAFVFSLTWGVFGCLVHGLRFRHLISVGDVYLYQLEWYYRFMVWSPWVAALTCIAIAVALWCCLFAITIPFHYTTNKPGLSVRTCWRCEKPTRDKMLCGICGAFRPGRVATILLWFGSLAVTLVYIVHDIISIVIGVAAFRSA